MSRTFSTNARSLLQIIWKNTERVANGREHPSQKDPKLRVSGQVFTKDGVRITSGHWYHDGEVKFSKDEYNE
ncbi:uncharacterized protein BO97DRAFT_401794 [Aspergillus homomorphus CBS 101889]|uniref:Uncharacterized protein n=1 Tax=Aspergillus homomorphus (strain CBS 101889) TaxID=1450537 RepID=A0A395HF47_ASPHC|nr:hypothetical protein BO97DRAFT_401794 [Aspergillus homomorphus CBS 101889]RAL06512.1 hypothetical protein BO97DRAFT_401794 [Aspergillus homomorphus CBS 101889]